MASNNNSRPGGKRPNSPRYSDRYGPGHMNPYMGGQPGQSAFIREMEERQEAARRQSEMEQEQLRRQREQEAASRQREQEAARRAEAARAQAAQAAANAEAQQRTQTEEPARRRGREDNTQPKAMRDPDTRKRLRQIQERAVREAKSIARGDEADFGDIDFIQQPPDVRLRLSDDGQPLIALESDDGSGGTTVRWVPVVLSEKEMEAFFPAFGSAQESKGIDVQEEIRTPAEDTGSAQDDCAPEANEHSVDDLVLIPIAEEDKTEDDNAVTAAVTAAAAVELLDSEPDEPEEHPEPEVPRGGGLDALLSSLPAIEIEPEPAPENHAGEAAAMLAGAAVLAAAAHSTEKQDSAAGDDPVDDRSTEPPAVPVVEYNVADDEDDSEEQSEPEDTEDEAEDVPSDDDADSGSEDSPDEDSDETAAENDEDDESDTAEDSVSDAENADEAEQSADDAEDSDAEPDDAEADSDSNEDTEDESGVASEADETEEQPQDTASEETAPDEPEVPAEAAGVEEDAQDDAETVVPEKEEPEQDAAVLLMPEGEGEDAEPKAPPEPVRRPKHKRRRSRPTDVQMPEELAAAAAAREDSRTEEQPEPEPVQEKPAPRFTAVAAAPVYDDDDADQDDRMFTRSSRAVRPVFAMHEGASIPKYIDDDDFVERWLGDEEDDEDLVSQKKNRRRRISAFIGAATMVLALIGLIAVAKWGIGLLGNIGGSESQKDIYGEFVSPVVMSEVPVFETWDAIPQDKLLQSAVFSVLMDNDVTYERDDTGKFIIPSTDIVNAVKMLYGAASDDPAQDEEINTQIRNALYGSAGEDVTNEDAYYVDMEDSFHVADGLSGPAPNVTDISKRDNTVTLRVEYLEDLENGAGGILYARQIILNLNEDGSYFVKGIREQQD